jgi:nitrite reductase (NADH) large subunit
VRSGEHGAAIWVPDVSAGVFSPAELERIAEVALAHDVVQMEIAAGGRFDIVGVPGPSGLRAGGEIPRLGGHGRACRTCVGVDHCRFAQGDSTGLAAKIERRFGDRAGRPGLATAGCARNCPEAETTDIGAVAIGEGNWEIYVGGADGPARRKGRLLAIVNDEEDVLAAIGRFMALYRAHASDGETTPRFVERLGLERIRVMVEDGASVAPAFGTAMPAAVTTARAATPAPAPAG